MPLTATGPGARPRGLAAVGVAVVVVVAVGRVPGQRHLAQQHLRPPVQHLAVGERSLLSACTVFAPALLPLLPFAWV